MRPQTLTRLLSQQLTAEHIINISDNQHVMKLIQTVEILMINQKKSASAGADLSHIYVVILKDMFV